ncbi:MAG TPA: hypothetical protein VLE44_02025 [Candidatus Saccharimonadales bacterium]|nr:hypothetical protein [Candidatus Saccharimonadales bacterium]
MPAILAIPFVFLFGSTFPQQILAHILGAGIVSLTFLISMKVKKDIKLAIWSSLLIGIGSIVWYMSATGSVWLVGQLTSAFFLTLAIYESLTKKRVWVVGICLGSIYLSRPHVILALPLFLYLLKDELKNFKNIILIGLGAAPFFLFGFYYNFIRFGSIFDKAYFILPQILGETNSPWFVHGVENILYIPNNLRTIFLSLPKFVPNFPYIEPSWYGLAIWITTPAFILALKNNLKEKVVQFSWISIALISLVVFSHGGNGFAQFGYRFAVDFYPILVFLTIWSVSKKKLTKYHWILLFVGILVNLWGVLWINKFGWISY